MENSDSVLNMILSMFTVGGVSVWLINKLKAWLGKIGWIQTKVSAFIRIMAAVVAALGVVGIDFAWNGSAGTLLISGLTYTSIITLFFEWLRQYVLQTFLWKGYKLTNGVVTNGDTKVVTNGGTK